MYFFIQTRPVNSQDTHNHLERFSNFIPIWKTLPLNLKRFYPSILYNCFQDGGEGMPYLNKRCACHHVAFVLMDLCCQVMFKFISKFYTAVSKIHLTSLPVYICTKFKMFFARDCTQMMQYPKEWHMLLCQSTIYHKALIYR